MFCGRTALACVEAGIGRDALSDITEILGLPSPVAAVNFRKHITELVGATTSVTDQMLRDAHVKLHEHYNCQMDEVINVPVTFDGTWSKRGYTAKYGVGVVISVDTNSVLDFVILSKFCKKCSSCKLNKNSTEFEEWYSDHRDSGTCTKNFDLSSPAMEAEAAKIIFSRSVSRYNTRYKFMISDGDSKAFNVVRCIYGNEEEHLVEKLDCIGHVGKRMFRALENVRTTTKGKLADGKYVGGGSGRLTKAVITRLQDFYRNAIRQNVTDSKEPKEQEQAVKNMKNAVMAGLYHSVKQPNDTKRHQYCPESSWCDFKINGSMVDKSYHLDDVFLNLLLPVYERLSNENLLKRCISGYTQNQNESFNSLIWSRCPKHKWKNLNFVCASVHMAVLTFNHGKSFARSAVIEMLDLQPIKSVEAIRKDLKRMKDARRKSTTAQKKIRKVLRNRELHAENEKISLTGTTYESGAFGEEHVDS